MSKLQTAIENTLSVNGKGKIGKTAVKGEYRSKIIVPNPRQLTYSLDIDTALKEQYPTSHRWDYAIEYDDNVFFIEVHPANTSEIQIVLSKLAWLRQWLQREAPLIDKLKSIQKNPFYWIATQNIQILKSSSQYRNLAQQKLLPRNYWNYNTL